MQSQKYLCFLNMAEIVKAVVVFGLNQMLIQHSF